MMVATDSQSTESTADGLVPLCQADGCPAPALRSISSEHGHPDNEWKLCSTHYAEVDGRDPWSETGKEWTLTKLYYECPECGAETSHNSIQRRARCPKCGYTEAAGNEPSRPQTRELEENAQHPRVDPHQELETIADSAERQLADIEEGQSLDVLYEYADTGWVVHRELEVETVREDGVVVEKPDGVWAIVGPDQILAPEGGHA